jgi:hypothetical protein
MKQQRTLKQVDDDLKEARSKLLDSVRDTERWKTAWVYIDRLLDERLMASSRQEE